MVSVVIVELNATISIHFFKWILFLFFPRLSCIAILELQTHLVLFNTDSVIKVTKMNDY